MLYIDFGIVCIELLQLVFLYYTGNQYIMILFSSV